MNRNDASEWDGRGDDLRVWVTVPTYEEAENIEQLVRGVRVAVPAAHILVIDDNSLDGTAEKAEALGAELGGIEVLRRPKKMGLGSAYRAGHAVGIARGFDLMIQIDADLSHDPADLPRLLAAVEQGADLAIGSRYAPGGSVPNWPRRRLALSVAGNRYAAFCLGIGVRDTTAGYRAYRASMLRAIDFDTTHSTGYGFQIEMTYRVLGAGGRIEEIPIAFTDRVRGTSKMSWRIVAEAMLLVTWWALRDRVLRRDRVDR
ncbi:MAG: dolichol-phosphate mannosyltransferase [Actinomycetota bacterium]|nr:dolichol-phosphate mannosyltransferase [Actinomycetota bacterium]